MTQSHDIDLCEADVRVADRDRYLAALFAPAEKRPGLFALYAFNLELSRIADSVSEPILGEIRLQWWREAVDGVFADSPRDHGVVKALHGLKAAGALDRENLMAMIDARAADLEEAPFETLDDMERYAAATAGGLMMAAARALDPAAPRDLARAAGTAWGLAGLLRAVGFHGGQGRVMLPKDLLASAGLDPHDLLHGRASPGLAAVVETAAARARERLQEVQGQRRLISKAAIPAFLPLALARSDLAALRRARFDPFASGLRRERPGRLMRLMWSGMSGRL